MGLDRVPSISPQAMAEAYTDRAEQR